MADELDRVGRCGPECWTLPWCDACHRRKAPRGRSVGLAAANGYCDSDCEGYYADPKPGHYWSREEAVEEEALLHRRAGDA